MKKIFTFFVAILFLATLTTNAQPNISEIDYSTELQLGTNTGTLTRAGDEVLDIVGSHSIGKGFILPTEVGKAYSISCSFTSTGDLDFVGIYVVTNGPLELEDWGDPREFVLESWEVELWNGIDYTQGQTVTVIYNCEAGDFIRFLIIGNDWLDALSDLTYTIEVEEITPRYKYPKLNYSEIAVGEFVTGSWSSEAYFIIDPAGSTDMATGKGFVFPAEAGKTYHISCLLTAQEEDFLFDTKLHLLTGEELSGYLEDEWQEPMFGGGEPWLVAEGDQIAGVHSNIAFVSLTYTAEEDGDLRLLFCDFTKSDLDYLVKISEINNITLPELLDNTPYTISYSENLAFVDRGFVTEWVEGDTELNFRTDGENYYTVAYKIALEEGNFIEIHSSKEGDSYLYLYKAEGDGYAFIAANDNDETGNGYDNDLDSYMEFEAEEAGDYYIVITDRYPDIAGRYYLTVWNTITEPENGFPGMIIVDLSCNEDNIHIEKTIEEATDEDIRTALGALTFSGTTILDELVEIDNNENAWVIAADKLSATYTVMAPTGYMFDANVLSTITVVISYDEEDAINEVQLNSAIIYAYNKEIIVRNAETGSNLLIFDITGRAVANTVVTASEVRIPLNTTGIYIVRIGAQAAKVICR